MSPTNPYTPPTADITVLAEQELPIARPWSVWWALIFFTLGLLVALAGYMLMQQMMTRFDLDPGRGALIGFLVSKVLPHALPLAFLLFAGRRPIAYWVAVIALGWMCCAGLFNLGSHVTSESPEQTTQKLAMVFVLAIKLLTAWLFYRFTFGRASRQYFRIIK